MTLLGVDMYELADQNVHLSDILGERVDHLAEALSALPTWGQRFNLLDDVLSAWLSSGPEWSPQARWAYQELHRSHELSQYSN